MLPALACAGHQLKRQRRAVAITSRQVFVAGVLVDSANVAVSGSMNVTLQNGPEPVALALGVNSAALGLEDFMLDISLGFGGGIIMSTTGWTLDAGGPLTAASAISGSTSTIDLGGASLSLNEGLVTYQGTGLIGGFGTGDFSAEPLDFALPPGSTIQVTEADLGGGMTGVTVELPLSVAQSLTTDPLLQELGFVGQLTLTGFKIIPEPGAAVLLALGIAGLLPILCRRMRARS